MANYKVIEETIEMFGAMEKGTRFDMNSWVHTCGAPSCIAGFVVATQLPEVFKEYTAISHSEKAFDELLNADLISVDAHTKLTEQLEDLAMKKLGVQVDDLSDIFPEKAKKAFDIDDSYGSGIFWPEGSYWRDLDGTKPKHAVKALKRLLKDLKDNGEPDTSDGVVHEMSLV